ncbi:MAG: TonB-dependent receptor [Sphingomonadaceae bacterium]|nr:TonB-dependent receptor [Sphingomonadaceae bacterium]
MLKSVSLPALIVALATPAQASEAAEPAPLSDDEIVVIAERIRGQVDADQPPIIELNEEEIASYGADSLADLVAQLGPQTGSGRGRGGQPVFLINGQRVSGFREFRRYPPEAIRKVEVLSEEVAQRFGYPADQRVINFILKDNFASRELEVEYGGPTSGGSASGEFEASQLTINGPSRINLGAEFNTTSMLTEAERNVIQSPDSIPNTTPPINPGEYRSLIADSERYELEGTLNTGLGEGGAGGNFSLNGNFERSHSRSLFGLDPILLDADPLERRTQSSTYSLGSSLNKFMGGWTASLTVDAVRVDTRTEIDRRGVTGFDISNNRTTSIDSKLTMIGTPLTLPAGDVSLTFNSELDWKRIESDDTRSNLPLDLKRRRLAGNVNLGIPIAERGGAWGGIGDFSLNFSAGVEDLSDFGALTNYSAGLTWSPLEPLTLSATYLESEKAPSLTNLGGAQITSFNVPVYDFTNNTTALVTITSGGNPALLAEKQRDIKLSANLDLGLLERSNLVVEYFRNRSDNVTESFPLLTPAIEAAFPGRVTRDNAGALLAIDQRPVTFANRRSDRVRYGVNLFGRVGKAPARGEGGRGAPGGAPAGGPPAGASSAPGGPAGAGAGAGAAAFGDFRQKFCAVPEGEIPDITQFPEMVQERLRGADGKPDPARIAQLRARMCSSDGAAAPDPERFAALRKSLCEAEEGTTPDLSALPERMLERLKGPDGEIDPAKLAEFKKRLCSMPPPPAMANAGQSGGRSGGGGGGGRRGGSPFGPGGDGQGRWSLSLYHTVELKNDALIAIGGPQLDLLRGDALGSGGVARHKLQLEGGLFYQGVGMRLTGNYASSTTINGSGLPGSTDLLFGDLATFDIRVFINLEQQKWLTGENPGFFKGTRMSIRASNIFNARQRVTDSDGVVPLSYQPALIDPVGRYVEVSFRKMF